MQCVLRKLVTHYRKLSNTSHCVFHCHASKTFFSPSKPSQAQSGDHVYSSFHFRSWQSQHILSGKFHGSLLAKQFLLNSCDSLQRISSKSLRDLRPKILRAQFHGKNFDFNPSFDFYMRAWRSWFRRLPTENVILGLMIANVAVFVLWGITDQQFMWNNFAISVENIKNGRLHTLITHAFSHIDNIHVIENMIGLYFFGKKIGRIFGPEFLLKLYLAGAVGSSVFYLVNKTVQAQSSKGQREMDPSKTPALGSSGAVNAIVLLNIFLFPRSTIYLDFLIPVPAILLGIFYIGRDMLRLIKGNKHLSGSAHLGGAAVASIAWARVRRGRF